MDFMGIGLGELLLILVLALVVIGPERLPEVASQLGRAVADLRRQANQLSEEFQQSLQLAAEERKQQRLAATTGGAASGPYCAQCGARSLEGARYCSQCGHRLVEPPATTSSVGGS
ncbi:MAG: twin-arginine translocase subunit TatB [Chloroflexi bacterium]|nr:twin-arginine translocase subunit TatB [Chloroflexota bacterium]